MAVWLIRRQDKGGTSGCMRTRRRCRKSTFRNHRPTSPSSWVFFEKGRFLLIACRHGQHRPAKVNPNQTADEKEKNDKTDFAPLPPHLHRNPLRRS